MGLLLIAYPILSKEDYHLIQEFRKQNDEYYPMVEPHFTLVFPVSGMDKDIFIQEATRHIKYQKPIDFKIKCATVNKDQFNDRHHLFLVPDEGYSKIVRLHDTLYSSILINELRLDIDFIPHIGIGNSKEALIVKMWADEWNAKDFNISGTIKTVTVVDYTGNVVTDLVHLPLGT